MSAEDSTSSDPSRKGRFSASKSELNELLAEICFSSPKDINVLEGSVMMAGPTIGSALVIFPYTLAQLGLLPWIIVLLVFTTACFFTTYLLYQCSVSFLQGKKDKEKYTFLYETMAHETGGTTLRLLALFMIQLRNVLGCISAIVLCATICARWISTDKWSQNNKVRLSTTLLILVVSPLYYINLYKDLKKTAFATLASSMIVFVLSTAMSLDVEFQHENLFETLLRRASVEHESFFITFGTLMFGYSGPQQYMCNIIIYARNIQTFRYATIWTFFNVFIIYLVCGLVPYLVFGDLLKPSLTDTLTLFIHSSIFLKVSLLIMEILLVVHFLATTVTFVNPVARRCEQLLNFTEDHFSWRRFVNRSIGIIVLIGLCVLVPNFTSVISMSGGITGSFCCIIFPIIVYAKTFKLEIWQKCFLGIFLVACLILLSGNLVLTLKNIIENIAQ